MMFEEVNERNLASGYALLTMAEKPMKGVSFIALYINATDRGRVRFETPFGWGYISSEAPQDAMSKVRRHLKAHRVPDTSSIGLGFVLKAANEAIAVRFALDNLWDSISGMVDELEEGENTAMSEAL